MITKQHRFHGHGSLRKVYQQGKTVRGQLMNLKTMPRQGSRPVRVAVVVSRKVSKLAVVRNRIRRRVYEQVRLQLGDPAQYHDDLVFMVFGEQLALIETEKLARLVSDLLTRAGLLAAGSQSEAGHDIVNTNEEPSS